MKIFETNFQKGSLKDSISGELLTNNGAEFKQTWKGLSLSYKTWSASTPAKIPETGDFTIVVNFLYKSNKNRSILLWQYTSGATGRLLFVINQDISGSYNAWVGWLFINWTTTFNQNIETNMIEWNIYSWVIIKEWTNIKCYSNTILKASASFVWTILQTDLILLWDILANDSVDLFDVEVENNTISQPEINNLYKTFLARTALSTQTENFYYPKPDDLSNEDGLVAAYNFKPEGSIMTDVSGNGNQGTVNWPLSTVDGKAFDGVDDYIAVWQINYTSEVSFLLKMKIGTNNLYQRIFEISNWTNSFQLLRDRDVNKIVTKNSTFQGWFVSTGYNEDFPIWECTIWIISNSVLWTTRLFLNWIELTGLSWPMVAVGTRVFSTLGARWDFNPITYFNGKIIDLKIYSSSIAEQQIKDYHNARASQLALYEDFRYLPADWSNVCPLGRTQGTGLFKGVENAWLDGRSKALECTSSGTIAKQSKTAYGTWEFDIYKGTNINRIALHIIADRVGATSESEGYYFIVSSVGNRVFIVKNNIGSADILMSTANSYLQDNTTYRIKITRDTAGSFTSWIRGGSFGNSYTLIDVSGGTGTNPVTDNTHTTSNYMVTDIDVGDQISNINLTKWITR